MKRSPMKRTNGFAASQRQRAAVANKICIVCAEHRGEPAHVIDRSMASDNQGDPLAVVPLCRACHRSYDTGRLDLLPYLEPYYREQLAFAVEQVGLITALERITNQRWQVFA